MIVPPERADATVYCAVWHGDPQRAELLEAHQRCLADQDVPVAALYVFDGGDTVPRDLVGEFVVADQPLTIYQAWNVAVQAVRTPYVMNLNLDDRLEPGAVGLLAGVLRANPGVALVGGDWEVRYDQAATDAVTGSLRPAHALPYVPAWPPTGEPTRLGSGTGDRGTLGPGTMWRTDLRDRMTYPHQFADGTDIRSVGDTAWWQVLQTLGLGILRLPLVIGNYHSHPGDQAEFRVQDEGDRLAAGLRTSPYPMGGMRQYARH